MIEQIEDLVVTTHYEGGTKTITVDRFPQRVRFSVQLLEQVDPQFLDYADDRVTIKTKNGTATYKLGSAQNGFADVAETAFRIGQLDGAACPP